MPPEHSFSSFTFPTDVEEVEEDGMESIIVTPTFSTERDILSAGRAIAPAAPSN